MQIKTAVGLGVVAVGTTPLALLAGLVAGLGLLDVDEATLVVVSNTLPIDRTLGQLIARSDINTPPSLPAVLAVGMG